MNKHIIIIFFLAVALAAGYYAYQQGFFDKGIDRIENVLHEYCDPAQEDCSAFQDDAQDIA